MWRRSWNRMRGTSLRWTMRSKSWVIDSGLRKRPLRVAEHPVVGVVWEMLVSQPATPVDEDVAGVVVEFDGASAGAGLDAELDGFAADVLERA